MDNLFSNIPENLTEEVFEAIFHDKRIKIERIISKGHTTPLHEWYDQDNDEWVLLLQGSANIQIFGNDKLIPLQVGKHLFIPAHQKHRVQTTDALENTIWLAIHIFCD